MAKAKANPNPNPNPNHKNLIEWESLTQGFRKNQMTSCGDKGGQITVSESVIRLYAWGVCGVNPNSNPNPNPIALSETLTP